MTTATGTPLESPSKFRVDAARHERGPDTTRRIHEFEMMVLQEILTKDAEVQVFHPLPCQTGVQPGVGRDRRASQRACEIGGSIPGDTPG